MVVAEIDQQLIKTSVKKKKKKKKAKNKTEQWMEAMEDALCRGPVCVDYKNERMTVLSIDVCGSMVVRGRELPMLVSSSLARHMKIIIQQL